MEYTHSDISEDKGSIYIFSETKKDGDAPKYKLFRVPIEVLLDSNADDYCSIKVGSGTINLGYNSRNVQIYVDGDYKGQQDGTAIFSERTWDESDLKVTPTSGYYMDASKGSGTGKTKSGDKSGGTYQVYLVTKYTIEYNANGGSGTVNSQTHTYNQTQALATNSFTKTGYHFAGWNTKADGTGASYSAGQNVTNLTKDKNGKITLYAQWAPNTYTVRFNGNGSTSGSMTDQAFTYDKEQALNANQFARSGYTFTGWTADQGGSGTKYSNTQKVSNLTAENGGIVNLYAQWANLYKYSLVYDANGGSGAPATQNTDWLDESSHTFTLSSTVPTRVGYTFIGWYDAATGGNKISGTVTVTGSSGTTATKTLYAHWTPISYSISFNGNGSTSGTMSNLAMVYDEEKSLTANAYKREYVVTYDAQGGTCNKESDTSVYLFKGWEDRGSISYDGVTYTYQQFDAPFYANTYNDLYNAFKYNKYALLGHYVNYGKGEGRQVVGTTPGVYPDKAAVNNLSTENNATVPLYAQWASQAVTLPTPTKTGYTFNGWYTQETGGTKVGDGGGSYTPTGNVTIFAQWDEDGYKLTFDNANGDETYTKTYKITTDLTLPTLDDSKKKGYHFSGWKVTTAGGSWTANKVYDKEHLHVGSGQTGNATLTAQWEDGESDLTVSITGLATDAEYTVFSVTATSGKAKDKTYSLALNGGQTSATFKALPIGTYTVTALSWSQTYDVKSAVVTTSTSESHDITGDYEFKFTATSESEPIKHAEASVNNVWNK